MTFDCIIMNPPYDKNLHLKILAEAITHLKDDKSKCVNLSPDGWICNPFKKFIKNSYWERTEKKFGHKICEYEHVENNMFNELFSTSWGGSVGIYAIGQKNTDFDVHKFDNTNQLLNKIVGKIISLPSLRSKYTRRTNNAFFVPCRRTNHSIMTWCDLIDDKINSVDGIQFKNKNEEMNFRNSICNTFFYKWLGISEWYGGSNSASVPWLGDAINPRTGLKGYESEWTDEDFYQFFNITEEEQKVIEETMRRYKS